MSEEHTPAIDVRDVVKTYDEGRTRALDGATLRIYPGEFVSITGPSGCGKSTLLHAIAALERPDSGEIIVDGEDRCGQIPTPQPAPARSGCRPFYSSQAQTSEACAAACHAPPTDTPRPRPGPKPAPGGSG